LQYLARRAAKTRALLPLATLLREERAGGPEYSGALACFAYYVAAASTSYGVGYQQPNFTNQRVAEERDRETNALISATNTGANREIAQRPLGQLQRTSKLSGRGQCWPKIQFHHHHP
jgi:hypothetical protein